MRETWNLEKLLQYLQVNGIRGNLKQEIQGLAYDSRRVRDNYLFVAIPGLKNDGANFIEDAISKGAKAIISQENLFDRFKRKDIACIKVDNTRKALAKISSAFCHFPSRRLKVIGITGTNGKTTTTYLLESILKTAHLKVGVIGTINYRIGNRVIPASRTTPESLELQFLLKEMVESGITHLVMEVSSHALAQSRVSEVDFDIGIFTNFSQDHLDYHQTLEGYLSSKCLLFEQLGKFSQKGGEKFCLVNGDDPASKKIVKTLGIFPQVGTSCFGLDKRNFFQAEIIESNFTANRFVIKNNSEAIEVTLSLLGQHNVYNALAAAACSASLGIDSALIKKGLEEVKNIPGRFEFVKKSILPFSLVVDYAHTEEALRNTLKTARRIKPQRIILVFGCGGDRDKQKRPLMGKVAEELADFSILTTDNPRNEEPKDIVSDIEAGFTFKKSYQVILDRYQAIKSALKMAKPDDMIIVAGKGHENYQVYKDKVVSFSDREVIKKILAEFK